MNNNFALERSIIASVLNASKYNTEIEADLDVNYFQAPFHKKLVNGINRLKELDLPTDFELLRNKFLKSGKWSFQEDNALIELMTHTMPFSTQMLFDTYYDVLKRDYKMNLDRRLEI